MGYDVDRDNEDDDRRRRHRDDRRRRNSDDDDGDKKGVRREPFIFWILSFESLLNS